MSEASKNEFFSNFSIDEEVAFVPMYRHCKQMGIEQERTDGKIVAVRFTKSKVFYDILDNYYAKVFENVSSSNVYSVESITLEPQVKTE